jgi:hypothetical protein
MIVCCSFMSRYRNLLLHLQLSMMASCLNHTRDAARLSYFNATAPNMMRCFVLEVIAVASPILPFFFLVCSFHSSRPPPISGVLIIYASIQNHLLSHRPNFVGHVADASAMVISAIHDARSLLGRFIMGPNESCIQWGCSSSGRARA